MNGLIDVLRVRSVERGPAQFALCLEYLDGRVAKRLHYQNSKELAICGLYGVSSLEKIKGKLHRSLSYRRQCVKIAMEHHRHDYSRKVKE